MNMELRGTTICAVRKNGHTSIAGDGQVTMGQSVIFKSHAHKVRRLYGGQVVIGFAGAVADAFTLCDKFEEKLTQCGGNLERAAVALAQMWRSDSGMRQLETQMIVADKISRGARQKQLAPICRALLVQPWEVICWSSEDGTGRDQLLTLLEKVLAPEEEAPEV